MYQQKKKMLPNPGTFLTVTITGILCLKACQPLAFFNAFEQFVYYLIAYASFFRFLQGFKKILAGDLDNLPEVAFYMVGPIEEVVQKAEKLAAESN